MQTLRGENLSGGGVFIDIRRPSDENAEEDVKVLNNALSLLLSDTVTVDV